MRNIKRYILIGGFILVGISLILIRFFGQNDPDSPNVDRRGQEDVEEEDTNVLFDLGPGINLAGAEFGTDVEDFDYNYPTESLDYYSDKNFQLVRLPFSWERMQTELGGELSAYDVEQMRQFLDEAEREDIFVILDLHNYGRYNGQIIESSDVTKEDLNDLWSRLVAEFKDHPAVIAYGVMNEPYDMNGNWAEIAQSAVDAIRTVDSETIILVAGDNWSKSYTWTEYNNDLDINDPSDKIVYEAHVYFDPDHSGKYNCSFDECDISLNIGEQSVGDFISWLDRNDAVGFVGEYGVPADDDRWLRTIDQFVEYLQENQIGSTIWAGGPDWGDYNLSVEPTVNEEGDLVDKPQVTILEQFLTEE